MAFGDPINIDVTISGETNTIASFQGGETNVTRYSGGNNVNVTFDNEASTVTSQSGHNVEVTFPTGTSTSVDNAVYVIGGSSTPFSCSDLDGCNLFKSGDVTGYGNISVSGSGNYLIVSGVASAAAIEIKNKGATKTSSVSSMNFNQGYSITNVGSVVTIDSSLGISNLIAAQCDPSDVYVSPCEHRTASGIYSGQEADTLYLRGLIGTGTVTVTGYDGNDNFIYISGAAGGGSTQTATNIGLGSGIYSGTISDEFKLRSISGVSGIAVTGYEDNTIVVSGQTGSFLTGASNIGTGSGVYSERLGNDLKFKTLIAGPNIALSGDGEHIMISGAAAGGGGGGSTQTAANIGYGSGIYSGTISDEFKLRSLSGAGSVTIAGYEDSTIIVSGSAGGGGVTWTTPPPTHKNYAGTEGQISFDNQYYYVCIDTNEWRRVAISEW